MLLPLMLRRELGARCADIKIGFFLHTPFPCYDIWRALPVHRDLLAAILHCDLVGFHTPVYKRHFLRACVHGLDLSVFPDGVSFNDRLVRVGDFPIGIDPEKFRNGLLREDVKEQIKALRNSFQHVKVMVGVDRLDYIKGIPQKLHALDVFFAQHPEWIGKIVLIQVAVPTRQDVAEYQRLHDSVADIVAQINTRYGSTDYVPVHFLHKSLKFEELIAFYAISDVCLISSIRDGMNLVAYEYVACRPATEHTLVLSEFTGAAQTMSGFLSVNPWNTREFADAIHSAATDRIGYHPGDLEEYVRTHTSATWGKTFVAELDRPHN